MMSHYEHMTRLPETSMTFKTAAVAALMPDFRLLIYSLTCLCQINQVMRA